MENISLYRKYRPQNFDSLVGQKHILTTLTNALKRDNLAHAYLFAGPRGTGKTSMARLFAKSINCTDLKENFEPCDKCEFCQEINAGRLIDLIEIDAASNRGIDEIRDLKEKINFAPTRSKWKIYIIDEVHMLTKEAFNALLKTLEEPPSNVFFILATTEIHKIPETIISRCQRFDFRRIADEDVASRLKKIAELENFEVEEGAIDLIVEYSHGGLRDAIGLLEQLAVEGKIELSKASDLLGLSDRKLLDDFVQVCFERNIPRGLSLVTDIFNQGLDVKNFLHEVLGHLRKKMLKQVNDGNKAELHRSLELIEIFQKAKEGYNFSIPQLWLEVPLLQACLEGLDPSLPPQTTAVKTPTTVTKKVATVEQPAVAAPVAEVSEPVIAKENIPTERVHKQLEGGGDINKDLIMSRWHELIAKISVPTLRMSLKSARIKEIQGTTIILAFATKFHAEKVMESENLSVLEKLLFETFSENIKIKSIIEEGQSMPSSPPTPPPSMPDPIPPPTTPNVPSSASLNDALNIFGGELID